MLDLSRLNESQLDFFKEMESIGASHAANALSAMLGKTIRIKVPSIKFYEFSEISNILGGPENLAVSQLVEMAGDLSGFILLVQSVEESVSLANEAICAMGIEVEPPGADELFSQMQMSVLLEMSNILSNSYLSAISQLTGLNITCSVPRMVIDMAGAVMNLPAATYGEYGDVVLFLETKYMQNDRCLSGHVFLVPDIHSFSVLLKTMGIE